jgi:hypothetical protein
LCDYEEHCIAPLEKRIEGLDAENRALRAKLDKAVTPFVAPTESADAERWQ